MDTRIAERRAEVRKERMHRRRRRTLILLSVLALTAVGFVVEQSALVALQEVEVTGVDRLDADTVRGAAALPLGTSTLRLRLGIAAQRVEALPLVRAAEVHRVDPLTVRIRVTERQAELVLSTRTGPVLVDGEGIVLGRPRTGESDGLPVIAASSSPRQPGASVTEDPATANAFAVYAALPGPLRAEVERYEATDADTLDLVLAGGVRVRFGRAHRVAEKARVLGAILEEPPPEPVTAIDVRAPNNPVVTAG